MPEAPAADRFVDLLRHGEAAGGFRLRGSTDDPLTPQGEQQMRRALAGEPPWTRIVTSDLQRCSGFATALAEEFEIPLAVEPRLREIDFGEWEGCEVEALWARDAERVTAFWNAPFSVPAPGGEDPQAMCGRVLAAWRALATALVPGEHALVVSHGGPIRVILGEVLQIPDDALTRIEVAHASLSRIRLPAGEWPPSLVFHRPGA